VRLLLIDFASFIRSRKATDGAKKLGKRLLHRVNLSGLPRNDESPKIDSSALTKGIDFHRRRPDSILVEKKYQCQIRPGRIELTAVPAAPIGKDFLPPSCFRLRSR
jgi:hypothetical protein